MSQNFNLSEKIASLLKATFTSSHTDAIKNAESELQSYLAQPKEFLDGLSTILSLSDFGDQCKLSL